ncbi:hypothetical protein FMEAI12_2480009 [Parafrankia sp. Ea1.12]|nr:hypothetical protein FMEAI12_2480009 [Parafrankia sp. Ea1.12]
MIRTACAGRAGTNHPALGYARTFPAVRRAAGEAAYSPRQRTVPTLRLRQGDRSEK